MPIRRSDVFAESDVMQPLRDRSTARYLPASPATVLWGELPCEDDATVLSIDPGDRVTVDTVSHEGILEDQGSDPVAFFGDHGVRPDDVLRDAILITAGMHRAPGAGPHVVTGPIEVRGARPGDLLAVRVDRLHRRVPYGIVSSRHGKGTLPETFPTDGTPLSVFCRAEGATGTMALGGGVEARFPLKPFLGVMGVASAGHVRPGSVPPGPYGGNLDIKLLTEGAVLYLPVQVDGAGFFAGDPHFAQGNGEVCLTALEASLRAELTLDLVPADLAARQFGAVEGPFAQIGDLLVPTGLDRDLDAAAAKCVANAVELLRAGWDVDPALAYAYLSAAADFDISQLVDEVKGVHGLIRVSDLVEDTADGRVPGLRVQEAQR